MSDLVTFLRARLDEDEVAAAGASPGPWRPWRGEPGLGLPTLEHSVITGDQLGVAGELALIATASWMDTEHIARHDPARELREVRAKRRILDLHSVDHECSTIRRGTDCVGEPYEEINNCTWVVDEDCSTLRLLALPHSDHPDYREEWTP